MKDLVNLLFSNSNNNKINNNLEIFHNSNNVLVHKILYNHKSFNNNK